MKVFFEYTKFLLAFSHANLNVSKKKKFLQIVSTDVIRHFSCSNILSVTMRTSLSAYASSDLLRLRGFYRDVRSIIFTTIVLEPSEYSFRAWTM